MWVEFTWGISNAFPMHFLVSSFACSWKELNTIDENCYSKEKEGKIGWEFKRET